MPKKALCRTRVHISGQARRSETQGMKFAILNSHKHARIEGKLKRTDNWKIIFFFCLSCRHALCDFFYTVKLLCASVPKSPRVNNVCIRLELWRRAMPKPLQPVGVLSPWGHGALSPLQVPGSFEIITRR